MHRSTSVNVYGRRIAAGEPVLVIAEIGVNHDGSVARALELVEIAAECGADAVKLQIFHAENLMHPSAAFAQYQAQRTLAQNPAEMLRKYELADADTARIVDAIRDHGMVALATPFSPADVHTIEALSLPLVKIASPDLVNRPLLQHVAGLHRLMLLSTGAAAIAEIDRTVEWLREWGVPFGLLHCISSYPTPSHDANLCWITELSQRYNVPVGFSDHTTEILSGALAVAAGASIVEKHLTYSNDAPGPDHACSTDPAQFKEYVRLARVAERLHGKPGKRVLAIEEDVRRVSRQSLVLRRALHPGDYLREDDLTVMRPGTGIPPAMIDSVVGRKITRVLESGTLLSWDMLADAA